MKTNRYMGSFEVKDSKGNPVKLDIYRDFIHAGGEEIGGLWECLTDSPVGRSHVNIKGDDTYEVVQTGEILTGPMPAEFKSK